MRDRIFKPGGAALERLGIYIVLGISLLLGTGLSYYSVFYTEVCEGDLGVSRTHTDSAIKNVFIFAAVLLALWGFHRLLQRERRHGGRLAERLEKGLLIFSMVYAVAAGGIWVALSHVAPDADARSVCVVAECVLRGDFPMQPPAYMGYNPHQYGIVFVLHILFALFGSGNYAAWQYMNVLLFPLLIFAGYRIVRLVFEQREVSILYLLLVLGYLPLYFYLPYVYGDFASAACGMTVMWQTISFCKNRKYYSVFWGVLAAVFGCLVRRNTIIVVIAAVLVLLVCSLRRSDWRLLVMAAIMPVCIWGADSGVKLYYEHLSGQHISEGIPFVCYVMMGLEDEEEGPGWFNGSNYMAYARNDYDYYAAEHYGREQIRLRLAELWNNKSCAVDFFRRKVLTQWNMPDCYSLHETMHFDCEEAELPRAVRRIYYGEWKDSLLEFMNDFQFVLYVGFLLAVIVFAKGRKRGMEDYLLFVAVIGGFLFSILWEAMSRYVLAYVVYMIPLAAAGLWQALELLRGCCSLREK